MLKKRETHEALKVTKEKNGTNEGSKVLKKKREIAHTSKAIIKREKVMIKGVPKISGLGNILHLHFLIEVYNLHLLGSGF